MRERAGALLLAAAFGAGLLTGLSHFLAPLSTAIAVSAAAVVAGTWRGRLMAAAAVAGMISGVGRSAAERGDCTAGWRAGIEIRTLRLVDPGVGIGRVVVEGECPATVSVRWPSADSLIPAGAVVRVRARWRPDTGPLDRPDGLLVVVATESVTPGDPGWPARSRTLVAETIRERFGRHAPMVDALLAGRRGGIDRELRDSFAATGLVHILSISGFHIGLVIGWIAMGWRLLRRPRSEGELIGVLAGTAYVAWLGWPPPATRAAVMAAVVVVSRRRQRHLRFDGVIGLAALLVMVIEPRAVTDLGAWLSFAAMAGVVWMPRWVAQAGGPGRPLVQVVASSVGALLATAPIAALTIGSVAPVGVVMNLVAIPVAAAAVPGAILAVACHHAVPLLADGFAGSTGLLLDLLEAMARTGARLPGAAGSAEPGWNAALPWLLALAAALWVTAGRSTIGEGCRRAGWAVTAGIWLALVTGLSGRGYPGLSIHFLDVGQGDAIALRTPHGHWVLVDAGPVRGNRDAGERVVAPFLKRQGASGVALMVVTHSHLDHFGGAPAIMERFPVGAVLDAGVPYPDSGYAGWLEVVAGRGVPWHVAERGDRWLLDGVAMEVLHPSVHWRGYAGDPNEDSVVLLVEYRGFRALLTGDAGFPAESSFAAAAGRVDLLKVGHHGSRHSTGELLLEAAAPAVAVISSGENSYGHPAAEVLRRLETAGTAVWRNDIEGTIAAFTDGRTITIRGGNTVATYPVRNGAP